MNLVKVRSLITGVPVLLSVLFFQIPLKAQQKFSTNLSEDSVPPYILPDPLQIKSGEKVSSVKQWESVQRPYIYHLFEENVYGRYPIKHTAIRYQVLSQVNNALSGKAIRKQIRVYFSALDTTANMDILLYIPANAKQAVPVFMGLNFYGNQSTIADTGVTITPKWVIKGVGILDNKATEASRAVQWQQWDIEEAIDRGYAVATVFCGDLEPDFPEGWKTGIRFKLQHELAIRPDEWGAMGAWAWGLSRMVDYLEKEPLVNAKQIILIGHSRLGKAALWAGASDQRFAAIISNESGEGGAALSKRYYGETVAIINQKFPHWFAENYKKYNDKTDLLPIDQHMLLSLLAPRPLYVASALGDQWSDPKGEFLSAWHAGNVYALYGKKGVGIDTMPAIEHPVGNQIRYHIRNGKHDVTEYDWRQYLRFADDFFKRWLGVVND